MRIRAIIPHLLPFGGIRRFLEIGNVFIERGHEYAVHAKDTKQRPYWMDYKGLITDWVEPIAGDVILIADPPSFPVLNGVQGKVYIWVIAGGQYLVDYKKAAKDHIMILNSRVFRQAFPNARLCEGGVNALTFKPKTVRVGYYAGRGDIKGEAYIVESLTGLSNVVLVPLKGLKTPDLANAYRSLDYFVCAEVRLGWPNTAAEALACGTTVVSESSNTEPFSDLVINVSNLKKFFESPMAEFSWESTCDRLEEIWREDGVMNG